jgi:hypothetical protein
MVGRNLPSKSPAAAAASFVRFILSGEFCQINFEGAVYFCG